jgi:hypothetical protein
MLEAIEKMFRFYKNRHKMSGAIKYFRKTKW